MVSFHTSFSKSSILLRGYITNQTHAVPVITTTSTIRTCDLEDQFIGKAAVPRDHLLIQKCVGIDIVMSVVALSFSSDVVVTILIGDVIQICMTIAVPEITIH